MGSSPATTSSAASPAFLAVFRAHADAAGVMPFARFMELALYHPEVGYYRRSRPRVGYGPDTDFFTATTTGPVFALLVLAAATRILLDAGRDPRAHTFVEIGAEPGASLLDGIPHPFAATRVLRLPDPLELSGDCVVFSNELFDAQPCVRTVFRDGHWWEVGVRLADDRLHETLLPCQRDRPGREGYRFDEPLAAATLANTLAAQPWRGLFLALDYGKSLDELLLATPAGTARAYVRHTQSNDLLARPGEQDLTCHICWDWLTDALRRHGFATPILESQETFFIRRARDVIAEISVADATRATPRKLALQQLLHPAHLGQKFQALHALR